jgi:hypothetical protein
MEKTFVIAWKSNSEPRWGQGKKLFTREEAEALADEMNSDYPAFTHTALNLAATESAPAPEQAIIHVQFRPDAEETVAVGEEAQEAILA